MLILIAMLLLTDVEAQFQNGFLQHCIDEGSTAFFPCNLDMNVESPCWLINGTIYTFDQVPPQFRVVGYAGLFVQTVTVDLDGYQFQCIGYVNDSTSTNVMIVQELTSILKVNVIGDGGLFETFGFERILFDYNRLAVTPSSVVLPFTGCGPDTTYSLSVFIFNSTTRMVDEENIVSETFSNDSTFEIPFPSSDNLFYELMVLDQSSTDCFAPNTFFRLLLQSVNIIVHAPGDEVRLPVPDTMYCSFPRMVWPGNGSYCKCLPDSIDIDCINKCNSTITLDLSPGLVILRHLTSLDRNNTVISFECFRQLCRPPFNCLVNTLIKAVKVIIAGAPGLPNITVQEDSLICFSAFSHTEYPVEYFNVDVRDAVGMTSASGRFNASDSDSPCANNITIPLPACGPFDVNVTATNSIGTSNTASSTIGQGKNDCACFDQQTNFNVTTQNISSVSVIVVAICETSSEDLNITILLEDEAGSIINSSDLVCGMGVEFNQLQSSMNYSIRTPFRDSICLLNPFRTQDSPPSPPPPVPFPIWLRVVIAFTVIIILAVIIAVLALLVLYCFKLRRKYLVKQEIDLDDITESKP